MAIVTNHNKKNSALSSGKQYTLIGKDWRFFFNIVESGRFGWKPIQPQRGLVSELCSRGAKRNNRGRSLRIYHTPPLDLAGSQYLVRARYCPPGSTNRGGLYPETSSPVTNNSLRSLCAAFQAGHLSTKLKKNQNC